MTTPENSRNYMMKYPFVLPFGINKHSEEYTTRHSKHVLSQVIDFIEANERKGLKSIVEELKSKL